MNYLSKKQKIILGIFISITIMGVCYYIYTKDTNFSIEEKSLEIETNQIEETKDEEKNETEENLENILVHISGAVNQEGIISLKQNSRVADAIEKAGGLKENASIDNINLAYKIEDGMKIHIPTKEEETQKEEANKNQDESYITTKSGNVEETNLNQNTNTATKNKNSKVSINTATQTELETLPGIGPSTALKIIQYRSENGKFKSIEEIKEVSGIGESKFNQIKDLINI